MKNKLLYHSINTYHFEFFLFKLITTIKNINNNNNILFQTLPSFIIFYIILNVQCKKK